MDYSKSGISIVFIVITLLFCLLVSSESSSENPSDMYSIGSTLGGNGAKLGEILSNLERSIEHTASTKDRGLIYIASKEIENVSLTISLQGELLGVSQLIREEEKRGYFPHLVDILEKGNKSIAQKLTTIQEARTALSHSSVTPSLDRAIALIKGSLALLEKGVKILTLGSVLGNKPKNTYSEPTTFEACEFRVFFPTRTTRKRTFSNGTESVMIQSVYNGESPFMRAECLPLANPQETKAQFRNILENQARMAGILNPEITIQKSKLGVVGTYGGVRKAGGFDIKLFGKLIIGNRSLLSLSVSEELEKFPSDKAVYFLNTVEAR